MIHLWGHSNATEVMKVRWLLGELGLPYDHHEDGTPPSGVGTAGSVPVIDDDGFALFEGNAILRYLCNRHAPASPLYPEDAQARGTVDAWLDLQQTTLAPPMAVLLDPSAPDQATLTLSPHQAGEVWGRLDQRLQHHPYIAGETLTLADMAFGPSAHGWFHLPVARADAPGLRAWYLRLQQRPAYAENCMGEPS